MAANILVISAHPDDLEFGCAGTIAKFMEQGALVDVMICVRPGPEVTPGRNEIIVEKELNNSMALLGLEWHGLPFSGSVGDRPFLQCSPDMVSYLDSYRNGKEYDLVITQDPGDFHQDHVATFQLAQSFCRKGVTELWTMEVAPYANRNTSFKPNVFVDITEHIETKTEALYCYPSYVTDDTIENVWALGLYRGIQLGGNKYAEAFQQYFRKIK